MASRMSFGVQGLQEAQAGNTRAIAAVRPEGGLGRAVQYVLVEAHRYEMAIIHRDTSALAGAQRMELTGARGSIFTDPSATNPRSGHRVIEYAGAENNRGYPHNYAQRTITERGANLAQQAAQGIIGDIR